jgi:hypothetical protein
MAVKAFLELSPSVNVDHSLSVDEGSKSNPIQFLRHDGTSSGKDSITMRETSNG